MKIFPTSDSVRKKTLIAELLVMLFGIALSIYGIIKVCRYDMSYLGYMVFPVLGALIIVGVIISLIKKYKYAHVIIAAVIFVWGIFAGFGYLVCQAQSARLSGKISYAAVYEENTEERTEN